MTDKNETSACPYCGPIAALRAAEQTPETPESRFAERYANMRMRQLATEQQTLDADAEAAITALASHRRTLAEDLSDYAAPDAYQLDKLRSTR